jgi:FeS assembly protein IscX
MSLTWDNTREIAELLFERYDTLDPRTVRLADLRKWVPDLEDFTGQPDDAGEATLQAIQSAWFERWSKEYGGE